MIESAPWLEILLILGLILLNGVLAMSEIAVVSARKSRLRQRADAGDARARRALELAEHPTRFLSTVQIGITLVGVLAGAYGGASIAHHFDTWLEQFPPVAAYSEEIALGSVVAVITFLSLVIGELVPKRIALNHPERIAARIAGPMHRLSWLATPLVKVLTASTDFVLRLIGVRRVDEPPVTTEEVEALIDVGTAAGIFDEEEHDLVDRVFWLGDLRVTSLMTPRHRIEWLDIRDPAEVHRATLIRQRYSYYPVCDGDLDHILGMIRSKDLLAELLEGRPLDLEAALRKPLYIPETLPALRLLELFRESAVQIAFVIDEYGGAEGLVSLTDILVEITGGIGAEDDEGIVQREDGSWLVDASVTMDDFREALGLEERRSDSRQDYHTLGGLVMTQLGRIPKTGSVFEALGLRFEVVDMDGHRVDKVLVSLVPNASNDSAQAD